MRHTISSIRLNVRALRLGTIATGTLMLLTAFLSPRVVAEDFKPMAEIVDLQHLPSVAPAIKIDPIDAKWNVTMKPLIEAMKAGNPDIYVVVAHRFTRLPEEHSLEDLAAAWRSAGGHPFEQRLAISPLTPNDIRTTMVSETDVVTNAQAKGGLANLGPATQTQHIAYDFLPAYEFLCPEDPKVKPDMPVFGEVLAKKFIRVAGEAGHPLQQLPHCK